MTEAPDAAEFLCEGCGMHIIAIGLTEPPAHGLCGICAWLCEFVPDPEEMLAVRRRLDMDGK